MKNWYKRASDLFFCIAFLICLSVSAFSQNMFRKVNDYDGDGKADFAVTRNIGGAKYWYVWQSTAGLRVFQWGLDTDREVSGDWDGDGKTDFTIYRVAPNYNPTTFYIFRSSTNTYVAKPTTSGIPLDFREPIHQDYSGDGKTDLAYFFKWGNVSTTRNIIVYESNVSDTNPPTRNFNIPLSDTAVRLGDLTGDGGADIVTLNPDTYTLTMLDYTTRNVIRTVQFGTTGDQFVPADFDGDGKGDVAIFRESNGTWWWIRSSDGAINAAQFGQLGDKPVPADYDGDGKTDLAIWRPGETQSVYWVYGSAGNIMVMPFGIGTDKVVTY